MDCIFCRIAQGEIPATKVFENESVVGFEDLNPQAPVHVLFIPRAHVSTVAEVTDDRTFAEVLGAAKRYATDQGLDKGGFRLVLNQGADAGQTVFHLHAHLLAGRVFGWPPG